MELLFSIIGATTGVFGMTLGVMSFFRSRLDAVISVLEYDKNIDFIEARNAVHNMEPDTHVDSELGKKIALVILVFNTNALLVKKLRLPYWVFSRTPAMYACLTFYPKLEKYIKLRREKNPFYATNFEWLYKKILRKNKGLDISKYLQCDKKESNYETC